MTVFRLNFPCAALVLASALALGSLPALADDAPAQPAPAAAPTPPPVDPNKAIATVNGQPITERDFEIVGQDLQSQLQQMPPDQQASAILSRAVELRLTAAAAEAAGLDKAPDTAGELAYTREVVLRNAYLVDKLKQSVTEDAIKARFDQELTKFVPGDQIHPEHILVASEDEAKAVIADLDKGGDFAAIAKAKSTDSGSGAAGGDLGWFSKGATVKPFEDAAFALNVGEYTKTPVKTDFGWHVIKLLEKRKEPAPTLADRHDAIRDQIAHEVVVAEVGKLRDAAKIVVTAASSPDSAAPATPAPATPAPATQP